MKTFKNDILIDRMAAIDTWLEREGHPKLSAQLHLDRQSSECAYWHLGYSQAIVDIMRTLSLTSSPENTEDRPTLC